MATVRSSRSRAPRRFRLGFTLIEAALATAIVGMGILSMVRLVAACTQGNSLAKQVTTATLLADHIQEAMAGLPINDPYLVNTYFGPEPGETLPTFNDIDDFDASSFNPPIDSMRNRLVLFPQYTQAVSVCPVSSGGIRCFGLGWVTISMSRLSAALPGSITPRLANAPSRVSKWNRVFRFCSSGPWQVYRTSWIRMDR